MMLDDDRLAEAIRSLGDTIEIPAEGRDRILALAGGGLEDESGGAVPIVRQYRFLVAAVVVLVLGAGGVVLLIGRTGSANRASTFGTESIGLPGTTIPPTFGGASSGASTPGGVASSGSDRAATPQAAGSGTGTASGAAGTASGPGGIVAGPTAPAPPVASLPAVATRVIKTGEVDLIVDAGHVSPTINQLATVAAGFGGFLQDSKSSEITANPTGDVTIRVPSNQFEALLTKVRSLGRPVSVNTSGQDVTAQYVDLQSRISSLQASRDRYLEILRRANTIGDILAVQQQIDAIQAQIEQGQGQLNLLSNQTTYSTLAVHVSSGATTLAVPVAKPASGFAKSWAHARRSLAAGLEAVVAASGGLAVFVLCTAALALVARLAWAVIRRRLV